MKNLIKSKVCLAVLFALFIGPLKQNAQVAGCVSCIENSSECTAKVIIDFFCNGLQITNNTFTTIQAKTTYCPTWPSWATNCSTCDMQVTLVEIGGNAVGAPNVVSINNPGPVNPDLTAVNPACIPGPFNTPNTPEFVFTNGLIWILY